MNENAPSAAVLSRHPIAIVGVGALFPGSVDAAAFWRNIVEGKDLVTEVPSTHWLIEDYYDPDPKAPDMTYARRGAFLPDVDFDALGWGIPPSIMPSTDTSQLLALMVAKRVLEDVAQGPYTNLDLSRTSVILGVTSAQELLGEVNNRLQHPVWRKALREHGLPEDEVKAICERIASNYVPWQEATFPGLSATSSPAASPTASTSAAPTASPTRPARAPSRPCPWRSTSSPWATATWWSAAASTP